MDENGTYRWPGNNSQPKKNGNFKKTMKTVLLVLLAVTMDELLTLWEQQKSIQEPANKTGQWQVLFS